MFRPTTQQEPILRATAHKVLCTGGNRSGKTALSAAMVASYLRNIPITLKSGEQIHLRSKREQAIEVLTWVIGLDWTHLIDTIEKKLFKPGLFPIIRDQVTREWRAVDPESDYDNAHKDDWRDAPPLIPSWEIEDYQWRIQRCHVVLKHNRGVLTGYASSGNLKQGDAVHRIWVDENIEIPEYFADWQQRLASTEGKIWWSAYPEMGANFAFSNLYDECLTQVGKEHPSAQLFTLRQRDNPHISEKGYEIAMSGLSEEERLVRDEGQFQFDKLLMYPWFDEKKHVLRRAMKTENDQVAQIFVENSMRPPRDWSNFLILDPGTAHPALLAISVSPPWIGDREAPYCVAFQEIYPGRCDADMLAEMAARKFDYCWFEAFIIDGHAGRHKPMGFTETVQARYTRAFEKAGMLSRQTGSGWWIGSDDIPARTQAVTSMLVPQGPTMMPRLRIVEGGCPNLINQIRKYRRAVDKVTKIVLEKPAERQTIDLAVCLEYFAARDPAWVPQPDLPPNINPVQKMIIEHMRQLEIARSGQAEVFHCGPGAVS